MPKKDQTKIPFQIPLDGKLVTSEDPTVIGKDFQALQNMRYTDKHPESIQGMSKINTTAIPAYTDVRNAFHFKKEQPAETHLLVHSFFVSDEVAVLQNETAIPNQGDYSTTTLYTKTTSNKGFFSNAPRGQVAYCNGVDTKIWSGDEMIISSFINYDPEGTFKKDYTDEVSNTLTDSENIATLTNVDRSITSDDVLLLHLDNNVTNSGAGSAHTPVNNNGVTFTTDRVFGTHSATFVSASSQYIQVNDNLTDFDFDADDKFHIDLWVKALGGAPTRALYSRGEDANNHMVLEILTGRALRLVITKASVSQTILGGTLPLSTWAHLEVSGDGSFYYFYLNGFLVSKDAVSTNIPAMTGDVIIGAFDDNTASITDYFNGQIDEVKISGIEGHSVTFESPAAPYDTDAIFMYIGFTRPLQGFKFTVENANTTAGSMAVFYWSGIGWAAVETLVDNTDTGPSLGQTGTVTFDSTVSVAKTRAIDQVILYWYRVSVESTVSTTTLSNVTVDAPFQDVLDIWDAELRTIVKYYESWGGDFRDKTVNVFKDTYDSDVKATFSELDAMPNTDYILTGFLEKTMGVEVHLGDSSINSTANTILTVYYSSDGNTWTQVDGMIDGTEEGGISFAKSGVITWTAPDAEFKREIAGEAPLYYYKLQFSESMSADVRIFYVSGMTAQKKIGSYKFPLFAKNKLMLCSRQDKDKNSVLVSKENAPDVYNGATSTELFFGDDKELTAGISLYGRLGSSIYDITLFFKQSAFFGLSGRAVNDFVPYQVSNNLGCNAPYSLAGGVVTVSVGQGSIPISRPIVIFQAVSGIYMYDNNTPILVSDDIRNFFDRNESSTRRLHPDYAQNSFGEIDIESNEYVFLFADGTSTGDLNRELRLDLLRLKWFEVSRSSGKQLQAMVRVTATNGNEYTYGMIDTGFTERLENGTTFDGDDIVSTWQVGDIALHEGSLLHETSVRYLSHIGVAKTNTANNITVTHYGDTKTAGTDIAVSPLNSGKRVFHTVRSNNIGPHVFHSFKGTITTNDETKGYEPIAITGLYEVERLKERE